MLPSPTLRTSGGRRYQLRSPLSDSGTWSARRVGEDRDALVVIAEVLGAGAADAALGGVLRDARALRDVNHPGVVCPQDVVTLDGRPCVVSRYIPGHDLRLALASGAPLSVTLEIVRRVASALARCHGVIDSESEAPSPVAHGGLDASSVRLTPEGRVRLVGFGRVQRLRTPSDDVFALGALLYLLLAGEPLGALPTSAWKHSAAVLNRALLIEGAPEPVLELITRCLDWDPERRPVAGAIARGLEQHCAAADGPDLTRWCALNAAWTQPAPAPEPTPVLAPARVHIAPETLPSLPLAPGLAPAPRLAPRPLAPAPLPSPAELPPPAANLRRPRIPRPRFMPQTPRSWRAKLAEAPTDKERLTLAGAALSENLPHPRQPASPWRPHAAIMLLGAVLGLGTSWQLFFSSGDTFDMPAAAAPEPSAPEHPAPTIAAPRGPLLVRVPEARDVILSCGGHPVMGLSTALQENPLQPYCVVDASFADGQAAAVLELNGLERAVCARSPDGELECIEDT